MRLIKMTGILAISASVAVALVGASSASATNTQLCKVHTEPCPAGSNVTTTHDLEVGEVQFKAQFIVTLTVKCTSLLKKASILALAAPQVGHIEELIWTGCTLNGNPCTITTTVLGTLDILKTALNLGTVELLDTQINIVCGTLLDCDYTFNGKVLSIEGSGHTAGTGKGMLTANELVLNKVILAKSTCPTTTKFTALLEMLENTFVVS